MSHLLRKLHRSSSSSSGFSKLQKDCAGCEGDKKYLRRDVPKGCLPVYVGKDVLIRFVIEAKVVNHPLFAQLLQTSVEEFGYEQTGDR